MEKQILLLASKMLEIAAERFSNHGCNQMGKDVEKLVDDPDKLMKYFDEWNGGKMYNDSSCIYDYDHFLMSMLSSKLKEYANKECK